MSSGIIALVLALVKFTPNEHMLIGSVFILLVSVPIILKLAPMETPTKPLDEVERKQFRKKTMIHLSIECAVIPVLFLIGLHSFAFVVCSGIMAAAGLVFTQQQVS